MDGSKRLKEKRVEEEKSEFVLLVDPSRRSGKTVQLKDEKIDANLYEPRANTSGFGTLRPFDWCQVIEKRYDKITDLSVEWFNIVNKDNLISECQIYLYLRDTKCFTLHVFLATGVILAKGLLHKIWASEEFPKLLDIMNGKTKVSGCDEFIQSMNNPKQAVARSTKSESDHVSSHTKPLSVELAKVDENVPLVLPTKSQCSNHDTDKVNEDSVQNGNMSSEFERIWEANSEIKNALKTIDSSLLNVNKLLEKIEQSLQDQETRFESAIKALECKVDSRISTEIDIIRKDFDTEIKKINNKINDKVSNLKRGTDERLKEFEDLHKETIDEQLKEFHTLFTNEREIHRKEKEEWIKEKSELLEMLAVNKSMVNQSNEVDLNKSMSTVAGKSTTTSISRDSDSAEYVNTQKSFTGNDKVLYEDELIILMDSNRRFLDPTKISPEEKLKVKILPCHSVQQSLDIMENVTFTKAKIIMLHFGVNDIESQSIERFSLNMKHIVTKFRSKYPDAKILVSEITPRMDDLNPKVKECNAHLKVVLKGDPQVYVIYHNFLDNDELFYDMKHIKKEFINRLAGNLKKALRRVLGIYNPMYNRNNHKLQIDNQVYYQPVANSFNRIPVTLSRQQVPPSPSHISYVRSDNTVNQRCIDQPHTSDDRSRSPDDLKKLLSNIIGQLQQCM